MWLQINMAKSEEKGFEQFTTTSPAYVSVLLLLTSSSISTPYDTTLKFEPLQVHTSFISVACSAI